MESFFHEAQCIAKWHSELQGGTVTFKGGFTKLRDATNSVVVFVRLSVRME